MKWPFRRKAGRHQLGAAVTGLPSAPPLPVPPLTPARPRSAVEQELPEPPFVPEPAPEATPQESEPAPRQPRVELGFRDGSTAALAPGSEQAKALTDIASLLTRRDAT